MSVTGKLEMRSSEVSEGVRSFAWPVLQRGNTSYPDGSYSAEIEPGKDRRSFRIIHDLRGAPLIRRLIAEEMARYACTVSSPIASYRTIHTSASPTHRVEWSHDDLGAPPLFIPLVVTTSEVRLTLDAASDGVAALWHGRSVRVLKGSKLLIAPPFQLRSSLLQLLSFELDENLSDGQFEVRPDTDEGFRFIVALAGDLHGFLRHPRALRHRRNIMTHIVSAALALLHQDYHKDDGEEGWRSHSNLTALADYLEAQALPVWDDPGFHAERVATALYPHLLPLSGEEDD